MSSENYLSVYLIECLTSCLPIRSFIFGFMEGSDYIQGLVMGWVCSHILLMLHWCPPAGVTSHLLLVAVRSPCRPSSLLISPSMPTSCRQAPPKRRRTCLTSWMEFWTAASRWVLIYLSAVCRCEPGSTCVSVLCLSIKVETASISAFFV